MSKIKRIINWLILIILIIFVYWGYYTCSQYHFNFNRLFWGNNYISQTYNYSKASKNLSQIAYIDHIHYIPNIDTVHRNLGHQIQRQTRIYGLLDEVGLVKPKKYYVLHFTYHSQLYPLYAPDACEASALRMALSTKGLAKHVSMKKFINRIPRSTNPKYGYTEDPYYYGDSASIYPQALAKYARKYYHANVQDISHSKKKTFIKQLKHGDPIVFEGAYQMRNSNSDHTLIIIGYRSGHPGQFLIADPFMWRGQQNKVFWTSTTNFMHIYRNSMRGERALVVKGSVR